MSFLSSRRRGEEIIPVQLILNVFYNLSNLWRGLLRFLQGPVENPLRLFYRNSIGLDQANNRRLDKDREGRRHVMILGLHDRCAPVAAVSPLIRGISAGFFGRVQRGSGNGHLYESRTVLLS
ncbi:MAG: hypothetical protein JWP25_3619 [Bradyrhizobium sp.]|nr:hypothetical protein [Bradyrhizobium sp.]